MTAAESTEAVYAEMMVLARRLRRQHGLHLPALTMTDYSILSYLDRNPDRTVTDTATEFGLNKSTASRQISGLMSRGLIERTISPDDGRVCYLEPSMAGREALAYARDELRISLVDRLDGWANTEMDLFAALLRRYNNAAH